MSNKHRVADSSAEVPWYVMEAQRAADFFAAGDLDEAAEAFYRVATDPNLPESERAVALANLGRTYVEQDCLREALECYDMALEAAEPDLMPQLLRLRGQTLVALQEREQEPARPEVDAQEVEAYEAEQWTSPEDALAPEQPDLQVSGLPQPEPVLQVEAPPPQPEPVLQVEAPPPQPEPVLQVEALPPQPEPVLQVEALPPQPEPVLQVEAPPPQPESAFQVEAPPPKAQDSTRTEPPPSGPRESASSEIGPVAAASSVAPPPISGATALETMEQMILAFQKADASRTTAQQEAEAADAEARRAAEQEYTGRQVAAESQCAQSKKELLERLASQRSEVDDLSRLISGLVSESRRQLAQNALKFNKDTSRDGGTVASVLRASADLVGSRPASQGAPESIGDPSYEMRSRTHQAQQVSSEMLRLLESLVLVELRTGAVRTLSLWGIWLGLALVSPFLPLLGMPLVALAVFFVTWAALTRQNLVEDLAARFWILRGFCNLDFQPLSFSRRQAVEGVCAAFFGLLVAWLYAVTVTIIPITSYGGRLLTLGAFVGVTAGAITLRVAMETASATCTAVPAQQKTNAKETTR